MRRITAALAWIILSLLGALPASAGVSDEIDVESPTPSTEGRTITATAVAGSPTAGTSPKGKDILKGCAIVTNLTPNELLDYLGATGQNLAKFDLQNLPQNTLYHFLSCPTAPFADRNWHVWQANTPTPQIIIQAVALAAYNNTLIPLPTPQTSPPGTKTTPLITQLQTWYWTDPTLWQPISTTATIPEFNISVTATATPTTSTWTPGDGAPKITCQAGTPWKPNTTTNPPCSYTYTQTTQQNGASQPLQLTATITWEVTYNCVPANNCTGPPNVPATITTTVTRDIWITEIKGLITR